MEVIKQPKGDPISERMPLEAAARFLFDREYYRSLKAAREALLSGIPVKTHFSIFTLAADDAMTEEEFAEWKQQTGG